MNGVNKSIESLSGEIEQLKFQLQEAHALIAQLKAEQLKQAIAINNQDTDFVKSADQTYRLFIEKMTEGAITINKEGVIVYSNAQFVKMVGLPLSKVTGIPFKSFIAPGDEATYYSLVEAGWKQETRGDLLLVGLSRIIPVQLSINILSLNEGPSLSIILTDLTAQKQTELLLKVNNEKLQQINYELELSNQDLHQFATVASHDLQEPLRKIQIFSNFLKDKFASELSAEAGIYLQKIISSSNRMKTLIIDILNYSQLSQDDISCTRTNLNDILNEVLDDYEILIREKKAKIVVETLPFVEVNTGQLRQVFQNIISNSLKFVRKGTCPFIQISAQVKSLNPAQSNILMDGGYCYLSFKDNGIGFDDKFAKNIFTLFRRLNTKDKFEGTGIGLAISKKIVEKHGGHIIAKGIEDKGSEFIIILPMSQQ
ncbi:hypothetical protein BH11BAC3_BH11BAC3_18360 [soil metagenome]